MGDSKRHFTGQNHSSTQTGCAGSFSAQKEVVRCPEFCQSRGMRKLNPEMANIVGQAKDLFFLAPLIESKENPPRLYVYPRNNGLMVQMSISGRQHLIGSGLQDMEIACRFADMATLRFKKYRRRLAWNYSEAQAIADTANTEENGGALANWLLARLASELGNDGMLEERKEVFHSPVKEKQKPNRRTVEMRLAELEKRVATLESNQFNRVAPSVITPAPPNTGSEPIYTPPTIWCASTPLDLSKPI